MFVCYKKFFYFSWTGVNLHTKKLIVKSCAIDRL